MQVQRRGAAQDGNNWPTPSASLFNDGEDPSTWLARAEGLKQSHQNGNGAGMPLAIAAKLAESNRWPTPTSMDSHGARNATSTRSNGSKHNDGRTLLDEVILQGGEPRVVTDASTELAKVYRLLSAEIHETDGTASSKGLFLSPRFVECLMSFPDGWTERPEVNAKPFAGVWHGWPARPNEQQHLWEAPRVTTDTKARKQRLKALGNAVVPEVARTVGHVLAGILEVLGQ